MSPRAVRRPSRPPKPSQARPCATFLLLGATFFSGATFCGSSAARADAGPPSPSASQTTPAAAPSASAAPAQPGDAAVEVDTLAREHDRQARPANSQRLMCSWRASACLHAAPGVPEALILPAFDALERSLVALAAFHLPLPLPDGDLGGGPAYDVYLSPEHSGAASYADNFSTPGDLDRHSAFGLVSSGPGPACAVPARVASAVGQAVALGLDAATHDAVLAMYGSYLAQLIAPCTALELPAIDDFQRQPWLSVLSGERSDVSGALLLPSFLDSEWGTGVPLTVTTAAIAASTQRSPRHDTRWRNEPDLLDTLRTNMTLRDRSLGDLLSAFAVARAFVGNRSDGLHLQDTEQYDSYGRVRFEWAVPYSSLPRRLAPLHAVEPTGSSYIWLDLSSAKPGATLLLHAEWEETFVMQWSIVRIDKDGCELGRLSAGGVFGQASAQLTLANLADATALLIVGTSLGDDDRSKPYDPEDGPPRPLGYTLTLHPQ